MDVLEIIKSVSAQHQVPWPLVAGICMVESSLDPWAIRYESSYKWLVGREEQLSSTERMQQMTSWGIMQVMGAVAREFGHKGWLSTLCQPAVSMNYGIQHLKKFYARYHNWPDAIASYNAGSPKRIGLKYLNQDYVDRVTKAWAGFEQQAASV